MKPSDIKRQHNSIREERRRNVEERSRLVHEAQRLAALARAHEDDRRAWADEREQALVVLRMLCTRFGSTDWDGDTPLAEILTDHLADPLDEMVARVNRRLRRLSEGIAPPPVVTPASPAPRVIGRGTSGPQPGHATTVQRTSDSFEAICSCSWHSEPTWTEGEALMAARAHVRGDREVRHA